MQFAKLNNITIHYRDEGPSRALPVVFSNSLGTDFRIWDDLIAALKNGAAGDLRFIRYDKRGHGLSDAPNSPYSMDDHVEDLMALFDHLDVDGAVVIGLSVGGMITQAITARIPERIRAVVLSNTGHKIGDEKLWTSRIMEIRKDGISSISDAILERWFSQDFRDNKPAELAAFRNMLERTALEGYLGTCAAIRDSDLTDLAKGISVPALLIGGSNDGSTPPQLMASTHELISGSRFEIIQGPGHLPCVEKPEETARIILQFLEDNSVV